MNDGFIFYKSFLDAINLLPEDEQLSAYKIIAEYAIYGTEPEGGSDDSLSARVILTMAKPSIDFGVERYTGFGGLTTSQKGQVPKNACGFDRGIADKYASDSTDESRNTAEPLASELQVESTSSPEASPVDATDPPPATNSNTFTDTGFDMYFLSTKSGNEFPSLFWDANFTAGKNAISVGEMLRSKGVKEALPEADKMSFEAGKSMSATFHHDTECTVRFEGGNIPKGRKAILNHGNKVDITFEDGVTVARIEFKRRKKSSQS